VSIIITVPLGQARPGGAFDLVLVDAPCSGSGTWRRQPELRWRLTEGRLAELTGIQDRLLDQAAGLVAPGGRLVYATCSILPVENRDRAEAFKARQPGFAALDLRDSWPKEATLPPPGLGEDFRASPGLTGTDGFYCAGFSRAQM
jgi:16S rRNA (cytosine967-C5)-methyltransferase